MKTLTERLEIYNEYIRNKKLIKETIEYLIFLYHALNIDENLINELEEIKEEFIEHTDYIEIDLIEELQLNNYINNKIIKNLTLDDILKL